MMNETEENLLAESRIRLYIAVHEYCRSHCERTLLMWCQDCIIREQIPMLSLLIRGCKEKAIKDGGGAEHEPHPHLQRDMSVRTHQEQKE